MVSFPDYQRTPEQKQIYLANLKATVPDDTLWLWDAVDWMNNNNWVPALATVLYLLFIYFGTKYMKTREEFNLQYPLAAWNFLLASM
jgi:hypothetical protein